jgi:transcriptional regulator with XRE-family HTH domain
MGKLRVCLTCKKEITGHFNRKRCRPCAKELVKRPNHTLTPAQQAEARRLAGTMMQHELADHLGCSRSNLIRWASRNRVSLDSRSYKPDVVRRVLQYYERHGKTKTQQAFPDVSVRSIVERNYGKFRPRQTKWSDEQIVEAARMAGLVSPKAQAKYFNRPNSRSGSIKALWAKRFGVGGCSVNGMTHNSAKNFVTDQAPYVNPLGESRKGKRCKFRRVCLWVDVEKHMRQGIPEFMQDAIKTLANFQRWLFGDKEPRQKIIRMMRQREKLCS